MPTATPFSGPTLYYVLHCHWCDQPRGHGHLSFCKKGLKIDWAKLRTYVLMRDRWRCRYCNWMPERESDTYLLHVDHLRPKSLGGRDAPWNLVTACARCNCSKGAKIRSWLSSWEASRCDYEAAVETAYKETLSDGGMDDCEMDGIEALV